jgi:nitroimidazol reductase NimA-like FMN-containing flavoprotein (pyridoxamine 5'-phosphate oxidase superfamily)
MAELFELSGAECRALLAAGLVARVAMCTPVGPHIVPVNYALVDDSLILRTTPYSLLGSEGRDATLALEVDQFDYERQRGWSVVARGRAEPVTTADDLAYIRRSWEPHAWASGPRNLFLRLRWTVLTGRRQTLFMGDTLRGLLLYGYAFATIGTIAGLLHALTRESVGSPTTGWSSPSRSTSRRWRWATSRSAAGPSG